MRRHYPHFYPRLQLKRPAHIPMPEIIVIRKTAHFVNDGDSVPLALLRIRFDGRPVTGIVDGKAGKFVADTNSTGWRFIESLPVARLSITVKRGESQAIVFDEVGRVVFIGRADIATGKLCVSCYTPFENAAGCFADEYAAQLQLEKVIPSFELASVPAKQVAA